MAEQEQDPYVHVLLVESNKDTISLLTLCLSEIKECELQVADNIAHALMRVQEREPDLILYSHNSEDKDNLLILSAIHQKHPSCYLIVSIPESNPDLMDSYMRAGARDCVVKDKNYVTGLVSAVKSALIRIAERESIVLSPMSRADQFAMDENLPDIVFLIDREGKILHVNRAITDFLGYRQNDVIHQSFVDLLGAESKNVFGDYLQRIDFSQNFRGSVAVKNAAAEEEPFEINCTCLEDMIYGVLRRDSSWEAVAQMIDMVGPEESSADLQTEPEEREDLIPARLGPYRVVTLLGAGAMGRVYKGYDEQLDRYVAIKVVGKSLAADAEYLTRFNREAKILASITHPNIALIYHYGDREGPPFFCMEFMSGGSVEEVLQKKGRLDPETAVSYSMQVALGLAEAAKKGVVHLDIKPSNLMLAENDRVKIVDFGLAKSGRDLESGSVGLVGTPHYIAPEQVQGNPVDFRADIYSLGVTLFRMLYGTMPFEGNSLIEILHNQLNGEMPAREQLNQDVPPVLYDIVRKMIARDPARRYANYSELIQDLENARRSTYEPVAGFEVPNLPVAIQMRGLLYDQPFAEILGEIIRRNLSGRLTLSWIDLRKNIHFKNGKIVAVLSNQEGESFIELLLRSHQLSTRKAKQIQNGSIDLFLHYSTAISEIQPDVRENVVTEIHTLAWKILQGLFSWMVGEFMFESDDFRGQIALQIPAGDVLLRGIKDWVDPAMIRRRLMKGQCRIVRSPQFQNVLPAIKMKPADTFLLFRFEKDILFQDLYNLSGIAEEEFFRLIYLFKCAGVVTLEPVSQEVPLSRPVRAPRKIQLPAGPAPSAPPAPAAAFRREEPSAPEHAQAVHEPAAHATHGSHPAPPAAHGSPPAPPAAPREKSHPPRPVAAAEERPPEAEAARPAQPAQKPAEMAQNYFKMAHQSYKNKNYWAAVEYCKKALEIKKDISTYLLMGNAFATHPNFRFEAMNAYKEALAIDPENPAIHRDMGDLYFKTGNLALARVKYQDVLNLDPTDEHATRRLQEAAAKVKK